MNCKNSIFYITHYKTFNYNLIFHPFIYPSEVKGLILMFQLFQNNGQTNMLAHGTL